MRRLVREFQIPYQIQFFLKKTRICRGSEAYDRDR